MKRYKIVCSKGVLKGTSTADELCDIVIDCIMDDNNLL